MLMAEEMNGEEWHLAGDTGRSGSRSAGAGGDCRHSAVAGREGIRSSDVIILEKARPGLNKTDLSIASGFNR